MANKDFRAKQIRISRIIGSGSEVGSGGSPHTMIYSASAATNFVGGVGADTFTAVGKDVGLFISGTTGQRNRWSAGSSTYGQGGVTLVGGDFHVSGNITTDGVPISGVTTGSFNVPQPGKWVTTASVSFAGPLDSTGFGGFSYAVPRNAPPLADAFFFVSGTKSSSGRARDGVPNPAVAVFGGDLVVSGTLYAERQVVEVDETVDGDFLVSGSMQVEKGAVINVAGGISDFRVETDNDTHALFVDGGEDTVAIGTQLPSGDAKLHVGNNTNNERVMVLVENEAAGNDYDAQVSFAKAGTVSHSIGVDDSDSDKLKITTGDDLGAAAASIVEISSTETVFNEGSQDLDLRVETDGDTHALFVDAGQNTVAVGTSNPDSTAKVHIGNETKPENVVLQIENESVGNDYDTQITFVKAGTATYSVGVDDSDSDKLKIATGDELGAATTSLAEMNQGGVVINEDGQDRDFRVESQTRQGAVLVDAGTNQVSLATNGTSATNAYGESDGSGMPLPSDISVYLSGTLASRQGSLPGVVVTAGDQVVSGSAYTIGHAEIGYDSNNSTLPHILRMWGHPIASWLDFTVDDYDWHLSTSGSAARDIIIRPETNGRTSFQVQSGSGGIPIFNVDTQNQRVGIGTAAPDNDLHIHGGFDTASVLKLTSAQTGQGLQDGILLGLDFNNHFLYYHYESQKPHVFKGNYGGLGTELLRIGGNNASKQVLVMSGGDSLSNDESNYQDMAFFVSGAIGSRGTSTKGVAAFGGDLHISGNLSVEGSGGGGITELSQDTSPELGGQLVTANNKISFGAGDNTSEIDFTYNGGSNFTAIASVKSIDMFIDSNGGDSGQKFRIFNNLQPASSVDAGTNIDTNAIFMVQETGNVLAKGHVTASMGLSGSLTRLTDGTSYLVAGSNITITSASNGQVTIDADVAGAADVGWTGPAAGAISTTGSLAIGTDLIHAGDVNTKISFTDDAIDIRAGGRSFIQITESGTDQIDFNESENANYEFVVRNSSGRVFGTSDSGVVINEQGMPASDFRVETNQKSHAIFLEADNQYLHFLADTASPVEASDPAIQFYVSGTKGAGDGVRKDQGLALFGGDMVVSGNLFVDPAGAAQRLALGPDPQDAYIKAVGPIPGAVGGRAIDLAAAMVRVGYDASERLGGLPPADSNFFISGSIGSRGTEASSKDRRGTAVFGGDVVISGSLRGRQLHYTTHKYVAGSTAKQYLRFDSDSADGPSPGGNNKMIAPYEGRLVKVIARGVSAAGSTTVALHTNSDGNTNVSATATGTAQTVDMSSADTSYTFNFVSDAIFGPGDIVGLSVDPQFDPGNVIVTAVWEYYTHEP